MKTIRARNVDEALYLGVDFFRGPEGVNYRKQESRNGITRESIGPVVTHYTRPWERVSFQKERDANPFFHLYEAIWMLAGSNKLKKLTYFNAGMADFSDDGETLNGAYGYRWAKTFMTNQIDLVIKMLKEDPDSRRCVLQMWDATHDLNSSSIDIPCNTNIYFKIRDGKLQMTVCNRSNDMIWGAYGANAVHMSILMEYVAVTVNAPMGSYYQISDSFHVYENKVWDKVKDLSGKGFGSWFSSTYPTPHYPLVSDPETFTDECLHFIETTPPTRRSGNPEEVDDFSTSFTKEVYNNKFFSDVMIPMVSAFRSHKERNYKEAYDHLKEIKALDWQEASFHWIKRRQLNWETKHGAGS